LRNKSRLFLIEGQVDRYPGTNETFDAWYPGRSGSFRGFEILWHGQQDGSCRVTFFVDAIGTRPIFYRALPDRRFLVSDKLSTLAINGPPADVNWGAVVEAMIMGPVYASDTTLTDSIQLRPGEAVEFESGHVRHRPTVKLQLPGYLDPQEVRRRPAATLFESLQRAVRELWPDRESSLLLSGGLDSRFVLGLAGEARKAITLSYQPTSEIETALEIGKACSAQLKIWPFPKDHYLHVITDGILLTGAMADSKCAYHLGLTEQWRKSGITGVAHAYLFDTLLKGWAMYPHKELLQPMRNLFDLIGPDSNCAKLWSSGRKYPTTPLDMFAVLTSTGQNLALERLDDVRKSFDITVQNGLDLTLDKRSMEWPGKVVDYPLLLSLLEAVDVHSPVFHPALWAWHYYSRPVDRYRGRAFRDALLAFSHPVRNIPDGNTGKPIVPATHDWSITFRRIPGYGWIRRARRGFASRPPARRRDSGPAMWPSISETIRSAGGRQMIEQAVGALSDHPLFEGGAIRAVTSEFLSGADHLHEVILGLIAAAQWKTITNCGANYAAVAVKEIDPAAPDGTVHQATSTY
jgi:hypothetical protein